MSRLFRKEPKDLRPMSGAPHRLRSYFAAEWPCLTAVTLTGTLYNAGLALLSWLEGRMVGGVELTLRTGQGGRLALWAGIYVASILLIQGMRALKRLYVRKFANHVDLRMKRILYRSLLRNTAPAGLTSADGSPADAAAQKAPADAGEAIAKSLGDAEACAEGMRKVTTEVFDTGVALVSYAVLLFSYDWRLTLIALLFPPLAAFTAEKVKKPVTESAARCRESAGALHSATLDRVGNGIPYRVHGLEAVQDEKYEQILRDYEKKSIRSGLWAGGMLPVYNMIALCGAILIVFFGGRNVLGRGFAVWDVAAFSTYLSCFMKLAVKAGKTSKLFNSIQKASVSWRRIRPRLKEYADLPEPEPAAPARLQARDLSFAYPGCAPVFSGLSFDAEPGQIIGVTGEIASGKTALGLCFSGENDYAGSISFGGTELRELLCDPTRRTVAYLGHQPELFHGTVAENILLGSDKNAAAYAELCALNEDIAAFPLGLDTRIGDRGLRLSGGQQARVALARTLCHGAPVFVLDDPFSALDLATEQAIFGRLRSTCKDAVILLISHRLGLFPETDGVVFLEAGRAVFSTHEALMEGSETYRRLYTLQAGDEGRDNTVNNTRSINKSTILRDPEHGAAGKEAAK